MSRVRLLAAVDRVLFVALISMACLGMGVPHALAHVQAVRTVPDFEVDLELAPRFVEVTFSGPLKPRGHVVHVVDGCGDDVVRPVRLEEPDMVVAAVRRGHPGRWRVSWKVRSVDGHVAESHYFFNVLGDTGCDPQANSPAATSSPSSAAHASEPTASSSGPSPLVIGAVVALGAGVFLLLWRRRSSGSR